jgi:hypothetical protein
VYAETRPRSKGERRNELGNDNTQPYCPLGGFPVGYGPWKGGWADNRAQILTRVINPGVGDYGNPSIRSMKSAGSAKSSRPTCRQSKPATSSAGRQARGAGSRPRLQAR